MLRSIPICAVLLLPAIGDVVLAADAAAGQPGAGRDYSDVAVRIADFILNQQGADGAIRDVPGGDVCNEDSNMEYALMGLAAAYWDDHQARFLEGLEKGIHWLAAREEMTDPQWRGSWFLAYEPNPPYAPKPVSPGDGVLDARGVDATSALFCYLLCLHSSLSGDNALARRYEANARAGLDFVLSANWSPDGFSNSSWQKKRDGKWRLWRYQYTADQGDVYLGLRSGELLCGDERYRQAASSIEDRIGSRFFDPKRGRFGLGRDKDGDLDSDFDGFDGIFPQGYIPWVFGKSPESEAAFQWLAGRGLPDGSVSCYPDDPKYTLSSSALVLAASSLARPVPDDSLDWIVAHALDPQDGGVRDTAAIDSEKFSNVAGFTVMALVGFPAFPAVEKRP